IKDQEFLTDNYLRHFPDNDVYKWHRDGRTDSEIFRHADKCFIILWSDLKPTLIKPDNEDNSHIYTPDKYEVVMFNNQNFLHRAPDLMPKEIKQRCLIRFILVVP